MGGGWGEKNKTIQLADYLCVLINTYLLFVSLHEMN